MPLKRVLIFFVLFISLHPAIADNKPALQNNADCQKGSSWVRHVCHRFHQIWYQGDTELYLTGYSWHNRYTYDHAKLSRYNELAWGGGLGKGFYDEDGDWQGISAFAFLDSHKNLEPTVGYAFVKIYHFNENTRIGAGYTLLVTQRPDIFHGIPFPGILPWVTFNYRRATIATTYIPGGGGAGNVLFILGKWTF